MPRAPPPNPTEKHTVEFQFQFDWQAAIDSIPYLAKGIPYTLMISFGGLAIGFVLGIVFGLLSINNLTAGIAAIALNSGAYISDVVRGGVQSVDKGQSEAGLSLGLSRTQTFWSIIWPQDFGRMIPPLGIQAIVSIKDTSLFSVKGVGELVRQGQVYIANTFTAFEVY